MEWKKPFKLVNWEIHAFTATFIRKFGDRLYQIKEWVIKDKEWDWGHRIHHWRDMKGAPCDTSIAGLDQQGHAGTGRQRILEEKFQGRKMKLIDIECVEYV